jgi:hypothetical protein
MTSCVGIHPSCIILNDGDTLLSSFILYDRVQHVGTHRSPAQGVDAAKADGPFVCVSMICRLCLSPSLRAQRSNPFFLCAAKWIASSLRFSQ